MDRVERRDERRRETDDERLDRNLGELLGELRVAPPGVQVLFALLLVVPFNQGYSRMSAFDRYIIFGTVVAIVATTTLLRVIAAVWYGPPTRRVSASAGVARLRQSAA